MNYHVRVGNENFSVTHVNAEAGAAQINGQAVSVDLRHVRGALYHFWYNGEVFAVQFDHGKGEITIGPHTFTLQVEDERSAALKKLQRGTQADSGIVPLKAPMPGLIVRLEVQPGSSVKKGQSLVVIEAMKMENEIKSPLTATVVDILVSAGTAVEKGAVLLHLKAAG